MLKKQLVASADAEPPSAWRAFERQALGNLQQRANEVTLISFTRLEARQVLTSIERIEERDLGPHPAFESLREKLRVALARMTS